MRNLLPAEHRKRVTVEYRLRVAVVVLSLTLVVIIVGIVLLIPSYFLSRSKKDPASEQSALIARSIEFRESEASVELLKKARDRLLLLADSNKQMSLTSIIRTLTEEKGIGVTIGAFSYAQEDKIGTLTIVGKALRRDNLLAFKEALDQSSYFSSVSLPISDLAKSRDIEFTLTLKTK